MKAKKTNRVKPARAAVLDAAWNMVDKAWNTEKALAAEKLLNRRLSAYARAIRQEATRG